MKRFQFSLETILSLRRNTQQRRAITLSKSIKSLTAINNKIDEHGKRITHAFARKNHTIELMRLRENTWNASSNQIKHLQASQKAAIEEFEKAQADYNHAYQNKKSLERLSQKRKLHWQKQKRKIQESQLENHYNHRNHPSSANLIHSEGDEN